MYKIVTKTGRTIESERDGDYLVLSGEAEREEFAGARVYDDEGQEVLSGPAEVKSMFTNSDGRVMVWLRSVPEEELALMKSEANIEYIAMMMGVEL